LLFRKRKSKSRRSPSPDESAKAVASAAASAAAASENEELAKRREKLRACAWASHQQVCLLCAISMIFLLIGLTLLAGRRGSCCSYTTFCIQLNATAIITCSARQTCSR
jgi:hypothetical protein